MLLARKKQSRLLRSSPSSVGNPFIETMPVERLRELQLKKFKRALHRAYNNSPFYRRIYWEAGLEPEDMKTDGDIRRIPKVEKDMLREVQTREPFPYGDTLSIPLREVTTFRQTTGTTRAPLSTMLIPGRTWNGIVRPVPMSYMRRAFVKSTESSCLSAITSSSLSGAPTLLPRR
jgi:hypothetical protein